MKKVLGLVLAVSLVQSLSVAQTTSLDASVSTEISELDQAKAVLDADESALLELGRELSKQLSERNVKGLFTATVSATTAVYAARFSVVSTKLVFQKGTELLTSQQLLTIAKASAIVAVGGSLGYTGTISVILNHQTAVQLEKDITLQSIKIAETQQTLKTLKELNGLK